MALGKIRFLMTGIFLVVGLLLAGGCSEKKSDEKAAETAAEAIMELGAGKDVDVNIREGKVEIKDKDSETEIAETSEWPSDMFSEVPRFTFGRIEHVSKTREAEGTRNFNIHLSGIETDHLNQYAEMLKKNGWEVATTQMGDKGGMLSGQKNKLGISFSYSLEKNDGVLMVFGAP